MNEPPIPNTTPIRLTLDAIEPGDLLRSKLPNGVWLRNNGPSPNGYDEIELRGPYDAVKRFVELNWGLVDLPDFDDLLEASP